MRWEKEWRREKKNCLGKNWTTNETKTRCNIYLLIIVKDIPRTSFCPQKWNEDENKLKWMETRISRKQTIKLSCDVTIWRQNESSFILIGITTMFAGKSCECHGWRSKTLWFIYVAHWFLTWFNGSFQLAYAMKISNK